MCGNACSKRQMAGKCKSMRWKRCGDKKWVEMIQAVESYLTSVVRHRLPTSKYLRLLTHDRGLNPEYETDGTILSCTLIKNPQGGLSHRYSLCVWGGLIVQSECLNSLLIKQIHLSGRQVGTWSSIGFPFCYKLVDRWWNIQSGIYLHSGEQGLCILKIKHSQKSPSAGHKGVCASEC